jgi:hypothetical protein
MIGRVRVSVVEPGTVDTELASLRPAIRRPQGQIESIEPLRPEECRRGGLHQTRDRRVAVNDARPRQR